MLDHEHTLNGAPVAPETQELPPPTEGPTTIQPNRHAEAGRKGAKRLQQLIQEGRLYEQEHGLKRGRQRLRQLIEEGKLYEAEHGLRPKRRVKRQSSEELLRTFFQTMVRLVKSRYRPQLLGLIQALQSDGQ